MNVGNPTEVTCVGETMVLVSPTDGNLVTSDNALLSVAGAEATVAMYLSDLGHATSWVGRVGDDPLGYKVTKRLEASGVNTRQVVRDPAAPTGVYFKDHRHGQTSVFYYRKGSAASFMTATDVDLVDLHPGSLLHLTGILPALSKSCAEATVRLVDRAIERGIRVSFDVNHRAALWPAADAAPILRDLSARADIVFVGLDEATRVWGTSTPDAVRAHLGNHAILVVKNDDVGATEYDGDLVTFVAARTVDVIEPVGAGDAFAAGYLSGYLRGLHSEQRLELGHRVAEFALSSVEDHRSASSLRPTTATAGGVR